jgi:3-oxoacyl-[acyl-carrier protein] reductase
MGPNVNRTVLVTGASKGIGAAIAERLGTQGYTVVAHFLTDPDGAERVMRAVKSSGGTGRTVQFDVGDPDACRTALSSDLDQYGPYYGVIHNAGIHRDNAFPAMTFEEWDSVLRTDLDSFYNVIQPCVMPMIQARRGGRNITLSSVSGVLGNRGQVNYSAAKAGLIGATKALALELAKRNITVNCIAPGLIETGSIDTPHLDEIKKLIPARRFGQPEEVAGVAEFLMTDVASYITRQVICVDGGLT